MNIIGKLSYIFCVVSLLTVPLAGCENPPWDSGMVLILKVDTPKDGATVTAPAVAVSGRVTGTESATATVRINDTSAPVKDGKFSADVPLTEGKNVLTIVAKSGQANLTEKVTVTYAGAKQ